MARYKRFADDSERDWGVMIFAGYSFEWHIEYRNANGTGLSPDPADPEKNLPGTHAPHSRTPPCKEKRTYNWNAATRLH